MLRRAGEFDVMVDATAGAGLAGPLLTGRRTPMVQVIHRIGPPGGAGRPGRDGRRGAALGRLLAGPVADRVAGDRVAVVPSPAARHELRRRLGFPGPIFVVPGGAPAPDPTATRAAGPTIVVDADLRPEHRIDLLLRALSRVADEVPRLRVHILGDGPELPRLWRLVQRAGLMPVVSLPGRVGDAERDAALRRAWLTVSTATADLCGWAVLRAAAYGVPCVALAGPGVRDFVRDGRTGRIVGTPDQLGPALVEQLRRQADAAHARQTARQCRQWADCFSWERSARLLAGVLEYQIATARLAHRGAAQRRYARSDIATLVRLADGTPPPVAGLRSTDEVSVQDGTVSVLLNGCDEFDALGVLARLGVEASSIRLATHEDLLVGHGDLPTCPHHPTDTRPPAAAPHPAPAYQRG